MEHRALGAQGLTVSKQGLGAMGMSDFYTGRDDDESARVLNEALDLGVTYIDSAEIYGPFHNEELIAKSIGHRRDEYVIASKFATEVRDDATRGPVNGTPAYARKALERSLKRLQMDVIDLYYIHRIDPDVPLEETIGELGKFIDEGKIRYIGLSEASPEQIRSAHQVHPISAVQTEYSLFSRKPEVNSVLDTVRELDIGYVAYAPLGRGLLTGRFTAESDFDAADARSSMPRFQGENLEHNIRIVREIGKIAAAKNVTPAQLAIAWVLHQDVVALPGTKKVKYVRENIAASDISLTAEEVQTLSRIAAVDGVKGDRYPSAGMTKIYD